MGCRSDYMEPNHREVESRKVIELMSDVGIFLGSVPYYGNTHQLDSHTKSLCEFCQVNDISKYSLELQMWWRDHKLADEKRTKAEVSEAKTNKDRAELISKLSDYERGLLGL